MDIEELLWTLQKVGDAHLAREPPIPVDDIARYLQPIDADALEEFVRRPDTDRQFEINLEVAMVGLDELYRRYFADVTPQKLMRELLEIVAEIPRKLPARAKPPAKAQSARAPAVIRTQNGAQQEAAAVAARSVREFSAEPVADDPHLEVDNMDVSEAPPADKRQSAPPEHAGFGEGDPNIDELTTRQQHPPQAAELIGDDNPSAIELSRRQQLFEQLAAEELHPPPPAPPEDVGFGEEMDADALRSPSGQRLPQFQLSAMQQPAMITPGGPLSPMMAPPPPASPLLAELLPLAAADHALMPPPVAPPRRRARARRRRLADPNYYQYIREVIPPVVPFDDGVIMAGVQRDLAKRSAARMSRDQDGQLLVAADSAEAAAFDHPVAAATAADDAQQSVAIVNSSQPVAGRPIPAIVVASHAEPMSVDDGMPAFGEGILLERAADAAPVDGDHRAREQMPQLSLIDLPSVADAAIGQSLLLETMPPPLPSPSRLQVVPQLLHPMSLRSSTPLPPVPASPNLLPPPEQFSDAQQPQLLSLIVDDSAFAVAEHAYAGPALQSAVAIGGAGETAGGGVNMTLPVPALPMQLLSDHADDVEDEQWMRISAERVVGVLGSNGVSLEAGSLLRAAVLQASAVADEPTVSARHVFQTICNMNNKGVLRVQTNDETGTFRAVTLD